MYGPWKVTFICQRPTTGSQWYRGNFNLGLLIDSHPRFVNVVIGLLFLEIGFGLTREPVPSLESRLRAEGR